MHKKKRLVQGPDSFFMDVKCKGIFRPFPFDKLLIIIPLF